jgi:hypothetical protein
MENELLGFYQAHPWATAGDASRALGIDRANAKRDSKKLAQRGLLQHRINGQAYEWAVAGNGSINGNGGGAHHGQHHTTSYDNPAASKPINGHASVTIDNGDGGRRMGALVPSGGMVVHKLPDTPASGTRGRALARPGMGPRNEPPLETLIVPQGQAWRDRLQVADSYAISHPAR